MHFPRSADNSPYSEIGISAIEGYIKIATRIDSNRYGHERSSHRTPSPLPRPPAPGRKGFSIIEHPEDYKRAERDTPAMGWNAPHIIAYDLVQHYLGGISSFTPKKRSPSRRAFTAEKKHHRDRQAIRDPA
jgi:hypothetical protein